MTMMLKDLRYTGTNIASVLEQQGRRKDWLAAQLGVSPSAVSRWVNGSRMVDDSTARRIAQILNIPFHLLFEYPKGDEMNLVGNKEIEAA